MGDVNTKFNALLAKLDLDAGVTDEDYASSLALTATSSIDFPDDILFPLPETEREREMYRILSDYFTQLRQALTEIESKLP